MSDGDVTNAQRVDSRNDLWQITVEPASQCRRPDHAVRKPDPREHGASMHPRRQPAATVQQPVGVERQEQINAHANRLCRLS